jgi:hypothetical protein
MSDVDDDDMKKEENLLTVPDNVPKWHLNTRNEDDLQFPTDLYS